MNKFIKYYEKACQELTLEFIEKYFCDDEIRPENVDYYWIGDNIGGTLSINDYFLDMELMVEVMKAGLILDRFFDFYDYRSKCYDEGGAPVRLKYWLNMNK